MILHDLFCKDEILPFCFMSFVLRFTNYEWFFDCVYFIYQG